MDQGRRSVQPFGADAGLDLVADVDGRVDLGGAEGDALGDPGIVLDLIAAMGAVPQMPAHRILAFGIQPVQGEVKKILVAGAAHRAAKEFSDHMIQHNDSKGIYALKSSTDCRKASGSLNTSVSFMMASR